MELIITLRKEIQEPIEGEQILETVKQRLADKPNIKVSGHITNHLEDEG